MIQSRPQFGYQGAILIYVIAVLAYVGTSALVISLMGDALHILFDIQPSVGRVLFTVVGAVVAILGYRAIHRWSRYSAALLLATFIVLSVSVFSNLGSGPAASDGSGFAITPFMLQFVAMAGGMLSWAPYVSDYTRYLPKEGGVLRSFLSTYLGMALSAIWVSALAAGVVSTFTDVDIISGFELAGDQVFNGFGTVILLVATLGSIILLGMSFYGAALTALTAVSTISPIRTGAGARAGVTIVVAVACLPLTYLVSSDFQNAVALYFLLLAYSLAPWTAINLVDFFFVRRGHYSVREIFNPRGLYGRWNWRGYLSYGLAAVAMFPFMLTPYFAGPVGEDLTYDIAPFIGILVGGAAYWFTTRSMDLDADRRMAESADTGLEDLPPSPSAVDSWFEEASRSPVQRGGSHAADRTA